MQTKIENWCRNNIDKVLHFIVGLLLAQLAYLCVWFIVLPLLIGIAKELYDKYVRKTGFNWLDIVATALGCMPIGIIYLIGV
ncbi:hypothetical protein [Dysgonomonas sp. 521]|uniref:hypothetical protein n=1 Tax=Dysgonomonas sp. 521 TaxID=2302932 RepID=UPI0013D83610|nr:hypothetical protein [Dysgonomonas sp. 521]